ncbi:hypothetical protein PPTG_06363, partial [Phytophthora nicotianae INRA-310]
RISCGTITPLEGDGVHLMLALHRGNGSEAPTFKYQVEWHAACSPTRRACRQQSTCASTFSFLPRPLSLSRSLEADEDEKKKNRYCMTDMRAVRTGSWDQHLLPVERMQWKDTMDAQQATMK